MGYFLCYKDECNVPSWHGTEIAVFSPLFYLSYAEKVGFSPLFLMLLLVICFRLLFILQFTAFIFWSPLVLVKFMHATLFLAWLSSSLTSVYSSIHGTSRGLLIWSHCIRCCQVCRWVQRPQHQMGRWIRLFCNTISDIRFNWLWRFCNHSEESSNKSCSKRLAFPYVRFLIVTIK